MSTFFVEYTIQCSYGVKMPRVGTEDGKNALFPIPPFLEQYKIVDSIDTIFPILDRLNKY